MRANVRIYYDGELCSYAYENQLTLDVLKAESFNAEHLVDVDLDRFPGEYLNMLPSRYCDMSGPVPRFEMTWDSMVYRDAAGRLVRIPSAHLFCSGLFDIRFAERNAFFAYMGPEHSQVIELLGETPRTTVAHICWAAYDVHVKYVPVMLQRRYRAHYRIVRYAPDRRRAILAEATDYKPTAVDLEHNNRPTIKMGEACRFDRGFDYAGADESSFWIDFGDVAATRWSRGGGADGTGSLITQSDEPVLAGWRVIGSQVAQHLQVAPGRRYEITARVRTENLRGKGVWIRYAFQEDWFVRQRGPIAIEGLTGANGAVVSEAVTGTSDWTTVTLTTPATPAKATNIELVIFHDGAGTSEVDSFHIRPVE